MAFSRLHRLSPNNKVIETVTIKSENVLLGKLVLLGLAWFRRFYCHYTHHFGWLVAETSKARGTGYFRLQRHPGERLNAASVCICSRIVQRVVLAAIPWKVCRAACGVEPTANDLERPKQGSKVLAHAIVLLAMVRR